MMRENGYITDQEYARGDRGAACVIAKSGSESTDAPYFVDLVNDSLLEQFQDHDFQNNSYRVYTTLDHEPAARCRRSDPYRDEGSR